MKKMTFIFSLLLLMSSATKIYGQGSSDLDRSDWTVITHTDTDYGYVYDTGTGSGSPQELIDGDPNTFLSLIKPGKGPFYGITDPQSPDVMVGFTVDMQAQETFNYFKWTHRLNHTGNQLRVFAIRMEVSNDGFNFTSINNNQPIWIPNIGGYVGLINKTDEAAYTIVVPETTCQYVKITYDMWSDIYNSHHPDYAGVGTKEGSTMQVGEFGLGRYGSRIMPTNDLDFGDVLRGTSSVKTLRVNAISLTDGVTATLIDGDVSAFSIVPETQTTPGSDGNYAFDITFAPTDKQQYQATLVLSSTGVDSDTIQLIGDAGFDLPVQISPEDGSDDHWYYIQFYRRMAANTVWSKNESTPLLITQDTLNPAVIRAEQQWKICGDWETGYYFINRASSEEITYNATASDDESKPADRYLWAENQGDNFKFVRFKASSQLTDDWQFFNTSATSTHQYINDQGGKHLCNYSANDAGNRLHFIPADNAPAVLPSAALLNFETPQGTTVSKTLTAIGLNLSGAIDAEISGTDASFFSLEGLSSLSVLGGDTLTVLFLPDAAKVYTATLTLKNGATTVDIPLTGNSDLGLPEFSTDGNEVWYYIQFGRQDGTQFAGGISRVWTVEPTIEDVRLGTKVMSRPIVQGNTEQQWKIVGNWTTGYKIISRNGGQMVLVDLDTNEEDDVVEWRIVLTADFGDEFLFKDRNTTAGNYNFGRWQLQIVNKDDANRNYLNDHGGGDRDNPLGLWSANDPGAYLNFIPVSGGGNAIDAPAFDPNDTVIAVKYYTLLGQEVVRPATTGVYIVRSTYASGKVQAIKQLFVIK